MRGALRYVSCGLRRAGYMRTEKQLGACKVLPELLQLLHVGGRERDIATGVLFLVRARLGALFRGHVFWSEWLKEEGFEAGKNSGATPTRCAPRH